MQVCIRVYVELLNIYKGKFHCILRLNIAISTKEEGFGNVARACENHRIR